MNSYRCKECGKTLSQHSHLTQHMKTHRPYSCKEYGNTLSVHSKVTTTMRTHSGEKSYSCKKCGKTFSVNGSLATHTQNDRIFTVFADKHALEACSRVTQEANDASCTWFKIARISLKFSSSNGGESPVDPSEVKKIGFHCFHRQICFMYYIGCLSGSGSG